MQSQSDDVIAGMGESMAPVRMAYDVAREVHRFSKTVKLGRFHGRLTRILAVAGDPLASVEEQRAQVRALLADFHVRQAVVDGALVRDEGGQLRAEPADCGRLYGFQVDGKFVQAFGVTFGPLRPGERPLILGRRGRPLFHAPRSFLP